MRNETAAAAVLSGADENSASSSEIRSTEHATAVAMAKSPPA
jgi:hypothetical protein